MPENSTSVIWHLRLTERLSSDVHRAATQWRKSIVKSGDQGQSS